MSLLLLNFMFKKFFTTVLVVLFSSLTFSQIKFEKGYFIVNDNNKVYCLIKNLDWLDNPESFVYKLTEDSEEVTAVIDGVKEFGVFNHSKFVRFDVDIDRSSNNLDNLSQNRNPDFVNERLFLKVLIEGKANLYSYNYRNLSRFFYSLDGGEVRQLVFKRYEYSKIIVSKNESYKQELWTNLKCDQIQLPYIASLSYTEEDLSNFFIKFNDCHDSDFVSYLEFKKPFLYSFKIKAGIRMLNYYYSSRLPSASIKDRVMSYQVGFEAEFLLPVNNYKWSIFLEPSFSDVSDHGTYEYAGNVFDYGFNYTQIEMPIGIRHYMYLKSPEKKLFLNAYYSTDFGFFNSKNRMVVFNTTTDLTKRSGLGLGFGYDHHKKFQVELRKNFSKSHSLYSSRVFNVNSLALVLGYTFL